MRVLSRLALAVGAAAVLRSHGQEEEDVPELELTSAQVRGMHTKMDADGNGKVSLEEIMVFSDKMRKIVAARDFGDAIDEMDLDKDGKLSMDELEKDMRNMEDWDKEEEEQGGSWESKLAVEKAKFKAADVDGDGFLNKEEMPALFYPETHDGVLQITTKAAMDAKDQDGDGKLSAMEFMQGDMMEGGEVEPTEDDEIEFQKVDKDGSKFVDFEEMKAWVSGRFHAEQNMKTLFEVADKDKDMHISADELDAAREEIKGSEAQYHLMEWAEHHEL